MLAGLGNVAVQHQVGQQGLLAGGFKPIQELMVVKEPEATQEMNF